MVKILYEGNKPLLLSRNLLLNEESVSGSVVSDSLQPHGL